MGLFAGRFIVRFRPSETKIGTIIGSSDNELPEFRILQKPRARLIVTKMQRGDRWAN
jgi:hypothetical protein